jgi:hypothetical protein
MNDAMKEFIPSRWLRKQHAITPAAAFWRRKYPLTVDKNGWRQFSQMAWINKRPTTSITAQVTP